MPNHTIICNRRGLLLLAAEIGSVKFVSVVQQHPYNGVIASFDDAGYYGSLQTLGERFKRILESIPHADAGHAMIARVSPGDKLTEAQAAAVESFKSLLVRNDLPRYTTPAELARDLQAKAMIQRARDPQEATPE